MTFPLPSDAWPPERIDLLTTLWASAASAGKIAAQINTAFPGRGFSASAIIGKAHRLGLPKKSDTEIGINQRRAAAVQAEQRRRAAEGRAMERRARDAERQRVRAERAAAGPTGAVPPTPPERLRQVVVSDMRPATLRDLPPCCCRWPLPGQEIRLGWAEETLFCGAEAPEGPYCAPHDVLAHQPRAAGRTGASRLQANARYDRVREGRKDSVFGRGHA